MLHLLLKWMTTTMDRGDCGASWEEKGRGVRRQHIAGKINILALAAHGEQQALMQPGDAQSHQLGHGG